MNPIVPIDDRLFRLDVLHEAAALAHRDPASLTDLHLKHVAVYSESDAVAYAIKRDRAIEAAERATALVAARQTVPPTTGADTRMRPDEDLEQYMLRCPMAPTPLVILHAVLDSLGPMIKELRQRNAALEARVLELEAQRVVASVER